MRAVFALLAVVALIALAAADPKEQGCQPGYDQYPFCDTTLSYEDRVADLVGRMTIAEKIQQMGNAAPGVARLGVPKYDWWSEALHGVNCNCYGSGSSQRCPSSFPTAENMGASFNDTMMHAVGVAISDEARGAYTSGVTTWRYLMGPIVWTPNINIFRDPRWGRGQETPGEDPFLSSRYAVEMITGLQESGNDRYLKLVATAKHFAAYSLESYGGQQRYGFNANVTAQDLFQTFYPAFQAAVTEANVHGIMCSYNAVNGVPSCANGPMLTDLLRNTWNFDGYVTGDCNAVQCVWTAHGYTKDGPTTAAVSLQAGTDTDCADGSSDIFQTYLGQAYNQSLITQKDLDAAMTHLYMTQMRLGMFDAYENQPFAALNASQMDSTEHRQLALHAAQESIVLLKNEDNTLPLDASSPLKVALIGPHATSTDNLCSNYHGSLPHVVSIQEALKAVSGVTVTYAQGCDFTSTSTSGFAAAEAAAQAADVAIVALGINTNVEAEGMDRTSIALPGVQDKLLQQILAVQPNTIVVLVNGGMVGMETVNTAPAVVEAFYPGEEGGQAIVDVLMGVYNPSGRLPITIYPVNFTSQADFFNYHMRQAPGLTYRFYQNQPVYEFGYGLSYTTFEYSVLTDTQTVPASLDYEATYQVKVTNTGAVAGDVSVLGFISLTSTATNAAIAKRDLLQRAISGSRQLVDTNCPLKQLFQYQKVSLAAGASTTLTFTVTPAGAFCVNENGDRIARPGTYTLTFGDASAQFIVATSRKARTH